MKILLLLFVVTITACAKPAIVKDVQEPAPVKYEPAKVIGEATKKHPEFYYDGETKQIFPWDEWIIEKEYRDRMYGPIEGGE